MALRIGNKPYRGAFYAVKACLSFMKQQSYGRILFLYFRAACEAFRESAHTASKAGLDSFMKTLVIELAKYKITVNAVEPGNIISEGYEELREKK